MASKLFRNKMAVYSFGFLRSSAVIAILMLMPLDLTATEVDFQPGIRLGQGFDTLNDKVRGECVVFEADNSSTAAATQGQRMAYELADVSDSSKLTDLLNLSLAAKYKSAFGTEVEGKAKFARENKVSQFANTFMAKIWVKNPARSIVRVKLTDEMATLAKTSLSDFRQKCGNNYVSAFSTGGEFIGHVHLETSNRSEQEKIHAEFKGKFGKVSTTEVETEAFKEYLKTTESSSKSVQVMQNGGNSEVVADVDTMFEKVKGFAASVRNSEAVPYQATLQDYQALPNFPNSLEIGKDQFALARILDRAWQLRSIEEDIKYIRSHRDQFAIGSISPEALAQLASTVTDQLIALETAAKACQQSGQCKVPDGADPEILRDQMPVRYLSKCDPIDVKIEPFKIEVFNHVGTGDTDMGGNSPTINMEAKLAFDSEADPMNLLFNGHVEMRESKKDWTTFTGDKNNLVVHTLRIAELEHCRYDQTQKGLILLGNIASRSGKNVHKPISYYGTGLLSSADCRSDSKGDDAGYLYCENIILNPIRLILKHEEDTYNTSQIKAVHERRRELTAPDSVIHGLQPVNVFPLR
jgi:hypothetical protein